MQKLKKQTYITKNGGEKVNCYHVTIPRAIVNKSGIKEDDGLAIYEEFGRIIIDKLYHCTCVECGFEWDDGKNRGIQASCPKCKSGNIYYGVNGDKE